MPRGGAGFWMSPRSSAGSRAAEANGGEFAVKAWMLINLELWFRLYFPEGGTSAYPAPRVVAGSPA